jgi:hypothetical protein
LDLTGVKLIVAIGMPTPEPVYAQQMDGSYQSKYSGKTSRSH